MSKLISSLLLIPLLVIVMVIQIQIQLTSSQPTTSSNNVLGFRCSSSSSTTGSRSSCTSLIDYKLPNTTTLSSLLNLFQIKNLRTLLSANNLPLSTSHNQSYPSSSILKIPFPCSCSITNTTGISDRRPFYTVVPGDGLFHIAADVFSNLVTFQQIQQVNNISDPNLILVGQKLWIPLPCSCDDVDGEDVVHYGHLVAAGSTLTGIAQQFNTTETTLLDLNGITNSADLKADSILDVPLKVCTSSVRNNSLDYPLLVPNGTYTFTANNCVRCQCNAANNWILECEPSGMSLPNMQTCPSMQCVGTSFDLGNTTSDSTCSRSRCEYSGYTNATIFTTLTQESTCTDGNSPSGNGSSGLRWKFLVGAFVIALHLVTWL